MNKHVVEVIGEAPSKGVSQLSEQELLLLHSHQLLMAYDEGIITAIWLFALKTTTRWLIWSESSP